MLLSTCISRTLFLCSFTLWTQASPNLTKTLNYGNLSYSTLYVRILLNIRQLLGFVGAFPVNVHLSQLLNSINWLSLTPALSVILIKVTSGSSLSGQSSPHLIWFTAFDTIYYFLHFESLYLLGSSFPFPSANDPLQSPMQAIFFLLPPSLSTSTSWLILSTASAQIPCRYPTGKLSRKLQICVLNCQDIFQ